MKNNETMYFTVVATDFCYGTSFMKRGDKVTLEKEPDNKYDKEAIMVKMEGLGKVGYVANSAHTVKGESMSAGRMYDKIEDREQAEVMYVMDSAVLCKMV